MITLMNGCFADAHFLHCLGLVAGRGHGPFRDGSSAINGPVRGSWQLCFVTQNLLTRDGVNELDALLFCLHGLLFRPSPTALQSHLF